METVLTLRRLANELQLSLTWLKAEAKAGRIPCLRAGRKFLFNPAAVEKVLAERAAAGDVLVSERSARGG